MLSSKMFTFVVYHQVTQISLEYLFIASECAKFDILISAIHCCGGGGEEIVKCFKLCFDLT